MNENCLTCGSPDPNKHPRVKGQDHELALCSDTFHHSGLDVTGLKAAMEPRPRFYRHPQGAYITVFTDGTMDVRKPDGKKKKTSATPEKLAAGHGGWQEVPSLDDSTVLPTPEETKARLMEAMPDGG